MQQLSQCPNIKNTKKGYKCITNLTPPPCDATCKDNNKSFINLKTIRNSPKHNRSLSSLNNSFQSPNKQHSKQDSYCMLLNEYAQNKDIFSKVFTDTKSQKFSILESLYLKYSNTLHSYFKLNKKNMQLSGNKKYECVPIDIFLSEITTYNKQLISRLQQNNLLYKHPTQQVIADEKIELTPLPNKSRLLMSTHKERSDYNSAERLAVAMRMVEYTHSLKNKKGKQTYNEMIREQKETLLFFIKRSCDTIQKWYLNQKNKFKEQIKEDKEFIRKRYKNYKKENKIKKYFRLANAIKRILDKNKRKTYYRKETFKVIKSYINEIRKCKEKEAAEKWLGNNKVVKLKGIQYTNKKPKGFKENVLQIEKIKNWKGNISVHGDSYNGNKCNKNNNSNLQMMSKVGNVCLVRKHSYLNSNIKGRKDARFSLLAQAKDKPRMKMQRVNSCAVEAEYKKRCELKKKWKGKEWCCYKKVMFNRSKSDIEKKVSFIQQHVIYFLKKLKLQKLELQHVLSRIVFNKENREIFIKQRNLAMWFYKLKMKCEKNKNDVHDKALSTLTSNSAMMLINKILTSHINMKRSYVLNKLMQNNNTNNMNIVLTKHKKLIALLLLYDYNKRKQNSLQLYFTLWKHKNLSNHQHIFPFLTKLHTIFNAKQAVIKQEFLTKLILLSLIENPMNINNEEFISLMKHCDNTSRMNLLKHIMNFIKKHLNKGNYTQSLLSTTLSTITFPPKYGNVNSISQRKGFGNNNTISDKDDDGDDDISKFNFDIKKESEIHFSQISGGEGEDGEELNSSLNNYTVNNVNVFAVKNKNLNGNIISNINYSSREKDKNKHKVNKKDNIQYNNLNKNEDIIEQDNDYFDNELFNNKNADVNLRVRGKQPNMKYRTIDQPYDRNKPLNNDNHMNCTPISNRNYSHINNNNNTKANNKYSKQKLSSCDSGRVLLNNNITICPIKRKHSIDDDNIFHNYFPQSSFNKYYNNISIRAKISNSLSKPKSKSQNPSNFYYLRDMTNEGELY